MKVKDYFLVLGLKSPQIYLAALGLAFLALFLVSASPRAGALGDVIMDDNAGTWEGTLGPTQSDIAENPGSIQINPSNTLPGQYEAALKPAFTSGNIISSSIEPDNTKFKAWKQVNVAVIRPSNVPPSNSNVTFDILCGDIAQSQCSPLNGPLPGFQNITPTDGVIDISGISIRKIRVRANWFRQNTNTESSILVGWSAYWNVNQSINLALSKSPNPANPQTYANPPGASNNSVVTYSLSYALDKPVNNLQLRLNIPTGSYLSQNYTLQYLNSTDGGSVSGNQIIWNLGSKPQGTVATVQASFRVPTGPPNGTIFDTVGTISARNASNNSPIGPFTTPEEKLVISAKAYLYGFVNGPEFVAPGTTVIYFMKWAAGGLPFQSDVFNARHTFAYPTSCYDFVSATGGSYTTGSGTVSFGPFNYFFFPSERFFTVTLTSKATCPAAITTTWNITSNQDSSWAVADTNTWNANFDPTSPVRFLVSKNTWNSPTGPNQRIDYYFKLEQRSSVPVNGFYAVEEIPTETYFLNANYFPTYLQGNGVNPNAANPFSIWTSTAATEPAKNDPSWVSISGGGLPCSGGCNSPDGTNVRWVKWQTNNLYWDTHTNGEWPLIFLSVLTKDNLVGGTNISNTLKYYGTNTCTTGCNSNTFVNPVKNEPYFTGLFNGSPNPVVPNNVLSLFGYVVNGEDYGGRSTSDAKDVDVIMLLPDEATFLDTSYTITGYARCLDVPIQTNCPDENGVVQNNPSWLNAQIVDDPVLGKIAKWNIPLIYSGSNFPLKFPYSYAFYVNVKIKPGPANGSIVTCNGTQTCKLMVTGWNSDKTFQSSREINLVPDVVISSSPTMTLCKTLGPVLDHCPVNGPGQVQIIDQDNIPFQGTATYRLAYTNSGTGAATDMFIMDNIPGPTVATIPPTFLMFESASGPNGETVYWMSTSPREIKPSINDPGWQLYQPGVSPTNAEKASVTWVKWVRASTPVTGEDNPLTVELTVRDSGSANQTAYLNQAWIGYIDPNNGVAIDGTGNEVKVVVDNPGFISSENGNVGSASDIAITVSGPCPGSCSTEYLGVGQAIDAAFTSAKDWIVDGYSTTVKLTYDQLWPSYATLSASCDSVDNCLNNSACASLATCSGLGEVKHYTGTLPFDVNTTVVRNPYSGMEPLILFIDGAGNDPALVFNTDFSIGAETGIIFVVKGNVKVHSGVSSIAGAFLIDGQFSTGRLGSTIGNQDAGKYAAISIGRDGLARIVYLTADDVRFIRCFNFSCSQNTIRFLATITSVSSTYMELDTSGATDLPKIVVGQRTATDAKSYYINCQDENCRTKNVLKIDDAADPDIAIDTSQNYRPSISEGFNLQAPRRSAFVSCNNGGVTDKTCVNRQRIQLDSQGGGNSVKDVGNDTQIDFDTTTSPATPVITYVKRDGNQADLFMARRRNGGGGSCNLNANWDCERLSPNPQGYVGRYPSMALVNGYVRIAYNNTSQKALQYMDCGSSGGQLCRPSQRSTAGPDCPGGNNCEVQDYVSMVLNTSNNPRIVYNVKPKYTGGSPIPPQCDPFDCFDLRFTYCNTACDNDNNWSVVKLQQDIRGVGVAGTEPGVQAFTQALALGPESGDATRDYPRIVFYKADTRDLMYLRCTTKTCTGAVPTPLVLDSGNAITLPDNTLTVNGSVIAFGDINLERDLFQYSSSEPGEMFILQPRYFYLFREVWQQAPIYQEANP